MSKIEKITITILMAAVIASAALFGVWEDKVILYGPLLVLIYAAIALWVALRSRGVPSGSDVWRVAGGREMSAERRPFSSFIFHLSSFQTPPGGVCLLLFFLYSAVMIPFAVLPYEARIATLRFGCYIGAYWTAANILSRFPYRKAVWLTLLAGLVFIALYSVVQHRVNPDMLYGRLRYANYGERLGGTYICPNHIAHLFQMALPFCLVFLFIPQFGWFWRICFAYCLPLFGLLIYQTQSRAGILGAIAALSATVLFIILRKSRRAFYIALLVVPLLGAGALGALWAGSAMFRTRMTPVVQVLQQASAGEWERVAAIDFRPMTWADTVVMIKDRPLFGFGPGNYALTYEDYRTRWTGVRRETVHPHNEYLELIAEYGLVGGALFLSALIALVVQLIRFIRVSSRPYHALPAAAFLGALAGTGVHGLFDFELHNFPNALMLALLAGSVVAPLLRSQRSEIRDQKIDSELPASDLPPSLRLWRTGRHLISGPNGLTSVFRPLTSVILLLATAWAAQVMSSAWICARGDLLLLKGAFGGAEKRFHTAVRIDPQNWQADWGLGQVYYHYRYYELDPGLKHEWALQEQAAYAAAYRVNPKKEEVVYGLGRVELFLGNRDRGLDLLREAANYKRFNDFYWRKLGIELRKAGLYDEALSAFEYAQKLDRSNPTVKRNLQWLRTRVKSEK